VVLNIERILQPVTDFIRGNPIVSTAVVGAGVTGLTAAVAVVRRRKKAKKKTTKKKVKRRRTTRKKTTRKRKKKTKAQIKRIRLKNLAKARRARKSGRRSTRKIIRGRGLGRGEIKHSGKSTRGKFKVVSFRDKRTGKMVRFKARK